MFGLSEKEVRKIVREELKKELDEELEYYVQPSDVREIATDVVSREKKNLEDSYRVKRDIEEKVLREINGNIGNIVNRKLEDIVAEQVKRIEDKLLVELARQAMALDKNKEVNYS
jgi:chromatin segregation and condensation protein Rec8/ScpA/Scc1 (kleisin family)